ncbi:MAG: IS5/IS1182 family transposase, partial [Phycisphaerae bacterium]|nr:IS5/IS1182 family transposase [Phycisphaerae bacterium]
MAFWLKPLHLELLMYRKDNPNQLQFEDFYHPFGGKLNSQNRWITMANSIDWHLVSERYAKNFPNSKTG